MVAFSCFETADDVSSSDSLKNQTNSDHVHHAFIASWLYSVPRVTNFIYASSDIHPVFCGRELCLPPRGKNTDSGCLRRAGQEAFMEEIKNAYTITS